MIGKNLKLQGGIMPVQKMILIVFVCLLTACGAKKGKSTAQFVVVGADGLSADGMLMIYGSNRSTGSSFAIPHVGVGESDFEIENGQWVFSVIAWDGPAPLEGNLSCASVGRELLGGEVIITLTLTIEQCQSGQQSDTKVSFVACEDDSILSDSAQLNSDCNTPGRSLSYRLSFYSLDPGSSLQSSKADLVSNCINDGDSLDNSPVDSQIALPAFDYLMGIPRIPILIEAFDRANCQGTPTQYPLLPRAQDSNRQVFQDSDRIYIAMVAPECPQNFIPVLGNITLETGPFCVMKYEAKDGLEGPESRPSDMPWMTISAYQAYSECRSLSQSIFPGQFSLINNRQWMTLVYDLAGVDANWVGGSAGSGAIFKGHTDSSPAEALSVDDPTDPYDQTGNSSVSGENQRRTFELSSGEEIWDLGGNLSEWVDWGGDPLGFSSLFDVENGPPDIDMSPTWRALTTTVSPLDVLDLAPPSSYDHDEGFGRWLRADGSIAVRGGAWMGEENSQTATDTGVAMLTFLTEGGAEGLYGFRCVYNPAM